MNFRLLDLGLIDYGLALLKQKEALEQVYKGVYPDTLIICRHYPVITLGRQAKKESLLADENELKKRGLMLYQAERGGDVTYHGPGQLIIYPIYNLNNFSRDIHFFLRSLEGLAIDILAGFGIIGQRKQGATGVWLGDEKIASIGIAVKKWITFHGLALNIKKDDLKNFSLIRPCGMDIKMTSLESALGKDIDIQEAKEALKRRCKDDQSSLAGIR